jgi:hypothetical protein
MRRNARDPIDLDQTIGERRGLGPQFSGSGSAFAIFFSLEGAPCRPDEPRATP